MSYTYDSKTDNKPINQVSLYLDNAGFKQQQDNINNHEGEQKLDTSALSHEKEISGTDCVGLLLEHWRDIEGTGDEFRNFGTGVVNSALGKMMMSINNIDQVNADSIGAKIARALDPEAMKVGTGGIRKDPGFNAPLVVGTDSKEISYAIPWQVEGEYQGTNPFDEHGSFGGNQLDMGTGTSYGFFGIAGEDEELYDFIRTHRGYENYSDKQIHDLLKDVEDRGCTFVALANAIFYYYRNRRTEFESKFHFSMIGKNGDLNYRFLIMDIILETGFKIYTDNPTGENPLYAYFKSNPDEMKKMNLYDEKKTVNENAKDAVKQIINSDMKEITVDSLHGYNGSSFNRGLHYFKEKKLDLFMWRYTNKPSFENIKDEVNAGRMVICGVSDYRLEDINGNIIDDVTSGDAGHEVAIIGVTDDGRYIISSKGKMSCINPNKQKEDFKMYDHLIIGRNPYIYMPEVN